MDIAINGSDQEAAKSRRELLQYYSGLQLLFDLHEEVPGLFLW